LVVWVYEGDRLLETRTVKVAAQVRREVVVVTADVERGAALPREHLRMETLWLDAGGAAPVASVEHAALLQARRRIAAGTALRMDVVEAPLAIRKGDLVTVHCMSGGVVVKAFGRAQADAREGEYVDLRLEGGEKTFRARAAGRGRAVMSLDH
jgi:flagella basal body P-ring formation protein FlgA